MVQVLLEKLTKNSETKPFYATSEFYVFVGAELTTLAGWLPTHNTEVRTWIAAGAAAAYKLSRGMSKAGVKPGPESQA